MEYYPGKAFKLGFAPTRRLLSTPKAFNKDVARQYKDQIERKIRGMGVELVTLDFLNEEGLIYDGADAEKVARHFLQEDVDAVFAPHCNFGTEDAVAKVAARVGKPLLIWGPRDEAPDASGVRLRDSQCGLFATTKVLQRFGVPYGYITNCDLDDPVFERGFDNFIAAASAVKAVTRPRVGQLSVRPASFWSVKSNEGELLERFGVEVVPLAMSDLKKLFEAQLKDASGPEMAREMDKIRSGVGQILFDDDGLKRVAALKRAIRGWMLNDGLTAVASQCWGPMAETVGISPCFVFSDLTDEGLPLVCEGDIHGAITALLAQGAARGRGPVFLADVTVRHRENDRAELFWHCGVFPKSLARSAAEAKIDLHHNRGIPAVGAWALRQGGVTIARFDGGRGEYKLLMGHGESVDGPYTFGTYAWVEFKDWPLWEHRFIYGPYIHHCVGVYGHLAPALYEACRFIPGLEADPVEPTAAEIEAYLRG